VAQRLLGEESGVLELSLGVREPIDRSSITATFGHFSRQRDDEPEPILSVPELRVTNEPAPS
jgi:hypothetical protein